MEQVSSIPNIPSEQTATETKKSSVKIATPDLVIADDSGTPLDVMAEVLFEELGGQEIINISRNDIVNGQDVSYSLIGNLKGIQKTFNPLNIFSLPDTINKIFKNFSIRFDIHVPDIGTGPNGQRAYVLQEDTAIASKGDMVIDVVNMEINERVDVEIIRSGQGLNDTIYMEES